VSSSSGLILERDRIIFTKDGLMKRIVLFLSFLFLLLSCEKPIECGEDTLGASSEVANCPLPDGEQNPSPDELPDDNTDVGQTEDLPPETYLFDATVNFTNFETADQQKVYSAIEIIKKVITSKDFRERVLNFTFEGKKAFVDNNGLTNDEIYQILLTGKEELLPVVDHQMDLELELYYSWRSTVGYTYPDTLKIWMNTKFFNSYTPAEVAGNIFHEWIHKLGFTHSSTYSVSRDSSVPYAIGYLIEELGKQYE